MNPIHSNVRTLYWQDDSLHLLDQRVLPDTVEYLACPTASSVAKAISTMVVRGAPAIGIAAAYGVVLAAREAFANAADDWRSSIEPALAELRAARPTAVNLDWAVSVMIKQFPMGSGSPVEMLLASARRLHDEDVSANQAMGDLGSAYLQAGSQVMTHCNAGALATAGYGTALGVIRSARHHGRLAQVYATETRPWLQGARLTAWELEADEIPVTLLADSAAAQLMATGNISWVITGADRVAANGDVANKIGTYQLAVCARAHGVKFMVAAPTSTIDANMPDGRSIPIENRSADELLEVAGRRVAAPGVAAINPVFDVTPAELIDVLVTEKGALERPDRDSILTLLKS